MESKKQGRISIIMPVYNGVSWIGECIESIRQQTDTNWELLVLDEPVTGLDPAAAQDLYRTLDYLNKKEGIAIIMVTHDLHSALPYATAILHAGHGSWFYGDTASYLASPCGKRFGGEA